ncbi:hypothetical protein AAV35_003595 [Salimicrobium jeotgali]|uniref:Uncharacterized protein n=1 Tax=Salimicrobium jeotgali TaxID=1230341 RepID=K2FQA6_9BACI|nr:hypothetical protein AAV35_003595 [Salimicrobium jeotgali]EKE32996.1 hypothetical protein MJ3_00810 [Salimicrobium jeotgali]
MREIAAFSGFSHLSRTKFQGEGYNYALIITFIAPAPSPWSGKRFFRYLQRAPGSLKGRKTESQGSESTKTGPSRSGFQCVVFSFIQEFIQFIHQDRL